MAKRIVLNEVAVLGLRNLQEASSTGDMLHSNVRARLDDAIRDKFRNTGKYGYYLDHTGDGSDGDVIYSSSGDTKKSPYHISTDKDGKSSTMIDSDNEKDVVPMTTYQEEAPEADAADHMAAMQEAQLYLPDALPLYERFISKGERDKADTSDFAGKGKSFPILKPEDVTAAASSLGRAGTGNLSMDAIKRRIISIAKRKGWTSSLPKSWQDDAVAPDAKAKEAAESKHAARKLKVAEAKAKADMEECDECDGSGDCPDCDGDGMVMMEAKGKKMKDCPTCKGTGDCQDCKGEGMVAKESAALPTVNPGAVKLVESFGCELLSRVSLSEAARTNYPILVMSPGTGSSAHYSSAVVENAAKHVKPGTLMFWNHQTLAEEAARPEGDLDHLAAIITKQGVYQANGPKGPGIYAEAKVMADYAQKVEERAPHIGLSIRAGGTTTGNLVEGKPELKSIDHIESIDYVTKAGRGGMALAEAARNAGLLPTQGAEIEMTKEEVQQLIKESVAAVTTAVAEKNKPLIERAVKGDATRLMEAELDTITLPDAQKRLVRETVFRFPLPISGDFLDEAKFIESVRDEAKRVGKAFSEATGGGRVFGMGASPTEAPTETQLKEAERQRTADKDMDEEFAAIFESLDMPKDAAKLAVSGKKAA